MTRRYLQKVGQLFAAVLLLSGIAAAQQIYGGSVVAKDHGYQHGYRDGLRQGRADVTRNVPHNLESEDYRRADLGYESYMGERDDFQNGYRDGYRAGYDDGYYNKSIRSDIYGVDDRYDPDRRPRTDADARYEKWGYSDVAFDTGYRDGMQAGQNDLRQHKEYRPEKHDAYEDADHGYRKNYGDKNLFKEQYRKGFMRGYQDTFNRYR
ncbi:MAG: hypothetical protein NVS9B4_27450 [Candidatus Acidiferrum sp.]